MSHELDSQDLRTFLAIADNGSLSAAADALFITQPAVSKRLAALEARLDTVLFNRQQRPMQLTEAGETLKQRAHRILQSLEDTVTEIQNLGEQAVGTLQLACSHHIGLHYLPKVIQTYQKQHPAVQLSLQFIESEAAPGLLTRGEADLALVTLANSVRTPLTSPFGWQDPLRFVVSPGHTLAEQARVTLEDLAHYPALLPEEHTATFQAVNRIFRQQQLSLRPAIPTNFLETLRMMVSVGLGWSVLPLSLCDQSLKILSVGGDPGLERRLGALIDSRRSQPLRVSTFTDCLANALQELTGSPGLRAPG